MAMLSKPTKWSIVSRWFVNRCALVGDFIHSADSSSVNRCSVIRNRFGSLRAKKRPRFLSWSFGDWSFIVHGQAQSIRIYMDKKNPRLLVGDRWLFGCGSFVRLAIGAGYFMPAIASY